MSCIEIRIAGLVAMNEKGIVHGVGLERAADMALLPMAVAERMGGPQDMSV